MEEQRIQEDEREPEQKKRKRRTARRRAGARSGTAFLHFLQHAFFVAAILLIATVFTGSYLVLSTKKGPQVYRLIGEEQSASFEDSQLFNRLLGNHITDIICYGAIRSQMETDGAFDPKKEIDVTAFAGRYEELPREYITARYYLDDLLKWAQTGIEYEEIYMSGDEVNRFLSNARTVTKTAEDSYHS